MQTSTSRVSEIVDSSIETGKYRLLSRENVHEDELIGNLLLKISALLDSLDAGGKPLIAVAKAKDKLGALKNWLVSLDIWGSYTPLAPSIDTSLEVSRARSLDKLEKTRQEINSVLLEIENNAIARDIYNILTVVEA